MKILVLVTDYPCLQGNISLYYAHTRNVYYVSQGIEVSVLNFASKEDYVIDGIPVFSIETYKKNMKEDEYDILLCHSPNIRNHYLFLIKYGRLFPKIVFIFHGHEVLRYSKVYPEPYKYVKQENFCKRFIRDCYDILKLRIWRRTFNKLAYKSWFVFVSEWMYDEFLHWVKIEPYKIEMRKRIIYNSIGAPFEFDSYDENIKKMYDFITIRGFLDGSKYCIDVVEKLALSNPQYSFCIAGRGEYFKHNSRPSNITLIEKYLNHAEIVELLNQSRCALLPTRTDAQGVMACEIATFGIPLITSDIPVCTEIFEDFDNVSFINNDDKDIDLTETFNELISLKLMGKNTKYFSENTCGKEVQLFNEIIKE